MIGRRRTAELVEAAVVVLVAAFFYAATWEFTEPLPGVDVAMTPASFPQLILGLMIALGLLRGLLALRVPSGETIALPWDRVVLATAVLSLGYAVGAYYLGVLVPMPFYCAALAYLWGARRWIVMLAVGLGLPLAVYVFFELLFRSRLPLGPLFSS